MVTGFLNPEKSNLPQSPEDQEEFVDELLEEIVVAADMNVLSGPHSVYCCTKGNEGVTGIVLIETSHSSIHIWEKCPNTGKPLLVQFDLYSCKDFNDEKILDTLAMMLGEFTDVATLLVPRNPEELLPEVEEEPKAVLH
jgi:S-adenosylmethionine/arginine decarboxylase-like enzyme